jgi:hypothetical protein
MKDIERVDEAATKLVRLYARLDELSLIVRTNGNDVRIIAPDYDKAYMAKMLRIAASMLEERGDHSLN